ncbi:MAG: hypothetical protein ICV72_07865, partial [Aldersonia sp.]|nr:hypothetical protein [Aldersonia sp.]
MVALVAAGALLGAPAATAVPTTAPPQPSFETYCRPSDSGLAELSGTTFVDGSLYAVGDSGTDHRLAHLAPDCAVQRWIDVPVDPYDIEDVADYDRMLWLSVTGDNLYRRDTVALTRVNPSDGTGDLHRLTYPDGQHDAEALLVEPGGRPVIVTKEFSGAAGIYVPTGDATVQSLPSPGPTPLEKAGALMLGPQT